MGVATSPRVFKRGTLRVEVALDPLRIAVLRAGRRILADMRLWEAEGTASDRFLALTEGVIPHEDLGPRRERAAIPTVSSSLPSRRAPRLRSPSPPDPARCARERTGPSRRASASPDSAPATACAWTSPAAPCTWAPIAATPGPTAREELLELGGIPQGDYAPAPWLNSSAGYGAWLRTNGAGVRIDLARGRTGASARAAAGPLRLHLLLDPTPAARLRRYCALTGFPALLPEWGYGHWKSRDVYEHQDDVLEDFHGYRWHGIPLDAVVIDSPWETQYNTWEFNPHQFPDPAAMVGRMRAAGVRTVVWITPWVNLESSRRPAPARRGVRAPAP